MREQSPLAGPATPGTAAGAIEFLDAAAEKGWFNVSSAKALRTATVKILSIDDSWEQQDLRDLDLDEQFDRFQTLKHNEYSDGSMRVYKSRFNQAVRMYLARLDKDPNWKSYGPAPRAAGVSRNGDGAASKPSSKPTRMTGTLRRQGTADAAPAVMTVPPAAQATPAVRQIEHVYPLRDEVDVTLRLPRDLTSDEADALATWIRSLVRVNVPKEN